MPLNFLIIRWSGMGDIIMTLPALAFLKEKFPGCHISYLTDEPFAAIPQLSGLVDNVLPIDRRGFAKGGRFANAILRTAANIASLRKNRINIAFDLQGFGETAILAALANAPIRVGRIKNSALRKRIYNRGITADWEKDHRSVYFIKAIARGVGLAEPENFDRPKIKFSMPPKKIPGLVALNLGASTESRRWSEKNFFELAKSLSAKGFSIRLFLGPQETRIISTARENAEKNGWEFSCHGKMETLLPAIAECSVFVSNDTGPGHLAAALGLPVVTLFSTGDPDNVRPLAEKRKWFRDENDINNIKTKDVQQACLEFL